MQARKQMANAVQPLPPGVALNNPATNIYPPAVSQTVPAQEGTVVGVPAPAEPEVAPPANYVEQPASVSYFYSSLAPYGSWVDVDGYGLCWQPTVGVSNPGWRPYCDRGRWMWSDSGWYWYSDYTWGWAPFHYGRWASYPRLGWIWVPDTCWGPSWVSWRYSSSYCGWAPLSPAYRYRPGFGFSYYGSSLGLSFGDPFGLNFAFYNFVPTSRFCDRSVGLHVVRGDRVRGIHARSTAANNFQVIGNNNTVIINNGFGRDRIASATGGQVPTATVREAPTRANNRRETLVNNGSSMSIVRPTLPSLPERSQVRVPTRPLAPVAPGQAATVLPTRGVSDNVRDSARPNNPGLGRRNTSERPSNGSAPSRSSVADSGTPAGQATPSTSANSQGSGSTVAGARDSSQGAPARPNSRNFSRPETRDNNESGNRGEVESRVAVNNAPGVVRTPPAVRSEERPAASAPALTANRPATPTLGPRSTPNASARSEWNRVFADTPVASRPSTPLPPAVSRPTPSANASVPAARPSFSAPPSRPAPSYSAPAARPEPSRAAPSVSAPAPARSAPSVSAPSYSAPSRSSSSSGSSGNSGGGGRGGRGGRD